MIIAQIATPTGTTPSPAIHQLVEIVTHNVVEIDGDAQTVASPEMFVRKDRNQFTWRTIHLLAVEGDIDTEDQSPYGYPLLPGSVDGVDAGSADVPAVGMTSISLSLRENLDSAYVDINALTGHEDAYLPLWEATREILRAEGRTKVTAYADHPFGDELRAPSSDLSLAQTRFSRFLAEAGFELTQTETCSRLALPVDEENLERLSADAAAHAGDYRTVSWVGPTPADYRSDLVALVSAFHLDMPSAGIVEAEINYDVERLVTADQRTADIGITAIVTAAQHSSGQLVGYTRLNIEEGLPAVFQDDTLVLRDHRGHRLGMLMKTENLRRLAEIAPGRPFIQTWNAGENDMMWSINERLGFRPHSGVGQWQIDIA